MSDTFYRSQLTTNQAKAFYDEMLAQLLAGKTDGTFLMKPTAAEPGQAAFAALRALRLDHPEFFHLSRLSRCFSRSDRVRLECTVLYTPTQIARIRALMERFFGQTHCRHRPHEPLGERKNRVRPFGFAADLQKHRSGA